MRINPAYAPQQANINNPKAEFDSPMPQPVGHGTIMPTMPHPQDPGLIANQSTPSPQPPPPQAVREGGSGNGFFDFLGGLGDLISNNAGTLAGIGSIAGALDNAGNIRDLGYGVQEHLQNMGNQLNSGSQFQGYGVTSGLGNTTVGTDGSINLGVSPDKLLGGYSDANMTGSQGAFNQAMMGNYMDTAAQQATAKSLADPSKRQSEIFDQLMAIQNPMLDRQQAQQQANEYAMGRGGVRGSAYGGTAEDAAMARARADASNQAALNAMQQADSERQMFGQMAGQYGQNAIQNRGMFGQLGSQMGQLGLDQNKLSYMPMQMQMELLNQAQGTGSMAQTGQLTGQDYLAQMLLGGTNANINAQKVSSELMGNLYDSLLDNMGGQQNADGSGFSGIGGLFSDIGNLFGFGS